MTIQNGGGHRKLFLNRRKINQFDRCGQKSYAYLMWRRVTTVIVSRRTLRFNKHMFSTIFFSCPTFQCASWRALFAKLWQQPTIFFACLFTLVRAIFIRHPMEPGIKTEVPHCRDRRKKSLKAAKYEIQKPSTCRATWANLLRDKLWVWWKTSNKAKICCSK